MDDLARQKERGSDSTLGKVISNQVKVHNPITNPLAYVNQNPYVQRQMTQAKSTQFLGAIESPKNLNASGQQQWVAPTSKLNSKLQSQYDQSMNIDEYFQSRRTLPRIQQHPNSSMTTTATQENANQEQQHRTSHYNYPIPTRTNRSRYGGAFKTPAGGTSPVLKTSSKMVMQGGWNGQNNNNSQSVPSMVGAQTIKSRSNARYGVSNTYYSQVLL